MRLRCRGGCVPGGDLLGGHGSGQEDPRASLRIA